MSDDWRVAGLLLAAGAGSRLGRPKGLMRGASGEAWVVRGARVLLDSGCSTVVVVVGARADEVAELLAAGLPDEPRLLVQRAEHWNEGVSASLRAGLDALTAETPKAVVETEAVIVTLVDTPSLRTETVARIRGAGVDGGRPRDALVQATFGGRPGHPVFIGRSHWGTLARELAGDSGARGYLRAHAAERVECGDLESGNDIDTIENLSITQL